MGKGEIPIPISIKRQFQTENVKGERKSQAQIEQGLPATAEE